MRKKQEYTKLAAILEKKEVGVASVLFQVTDFQGYYIDIGFY